MDPSQNPQPQPPEPAPQPWQPAPAQPAPAAPAQEPQPAPAAEPTRPAQTPAQTQANPTKNPLNVMSPGEQVICDIKRHPIGLLGVYITTGILLALLFTGVALLPHLVTNLSSANKLYAFVGAMLIALLIGAFAYIAIIIYRGNRWIVTSDSITQMQQTGLFSKQTSQLSLENLEDVTFEQSTLIQTLFGFGTLKVETAGEHSKFQFPFCPKPQQCAVDIIKAHESYMNEIQPQRYNGNGLNTNTQAS